MPLVDPESFGFLVTDAARLLRAEMDRRIADAGLGLTAGEGRVLSHVARAGAVRQSMLAERIGIEAMTLSTYVDRLEARGLVERRPDPEDRRAKIVHLTEAAETTLAAIAPIAAEIREGAGVGLTAEEWASFVRMLRTVRDNLADLRADRQSADRMNADTVGAAA